MSFKRHSVLCLVVLLCGCASTLFRSVQQAPDFDAARLHRVMIFGLFKNPDIRQRVEAEFVKRWKKHGVEAVSSIQALPANTPMTQDAVKPLLIKGKYDAALVMRVLDKRTVGPGEVAYSTTAVSAAEQTGDSEAWKDVYRGPPVYAAPNTLVAMEASLYEVPSGKRAWMAVTETRLFSDVTGRIESYVQDIIKKIGP
jgi:hypothetical protein